VGAKGGEFGLDMEDSHLEAQAFGCRHTQLTERALLGYWQNGGAVGTSLIKVPATIMGSSEGLLDIFSPECVPPSGCGVILPGKGECCGVVSPGRPGGTRRARRLLQASTFEMGALGFRLRTTQIALPIGKEGKDA
jgi:hypothetical protein